MPKMPIVKPEGFPGLAIVGDGGFIEVGIGWTVEGVGERVGTGVVVGVIVGVTVGPDSIGVGERVGTGVDVGVIVGVTVGVAEGVADSDI